MPEHGLFRALGLGTSDVIDALTELHADGRLVFHVQGNVTLITIPGAGEE